MHIVHPCTPHTWEVGCKGVSGMGKSVCSRRSFLGGAAAVTLGAGPVAAFDQPIALPTDITSGDQATVVAVRARSAFVAMTFDDGPHPRHTPILLDMLKARGIRATFYLIGENVVRYPALVRRIVEERHEIGNHTWSHPFLTQRSPSQVIAELDRTTLAIFEATGKAPRTMRPPYGAMNRRQRLMVHQERKMPTILWSVDPQDWQRPGSSVVARRIISASRAGAIVLAHDIHGPTVRAMPATLDGLRSRGFDFVTVSQALGWRDWSDITFKRKV